MSEIQRIDHVGIAVADLDEAIRLYTLLLGRGPDAVEEIPDQKVRVAFFRAGDSHIELVCPTSDTSPISGFLAKRGGGIHHICLAVPDLSRALAELQAHGMQLLDSVPRPGARGKRIAFLHPRALGGVLLELSESPRPSPCTPHPHTPHTGPQPD